MIWLSRVPASMDLGFALTKYIRSLPAVLLLGCSIPNVAPAADDYLSILEAEADSTGSASTVSAAEVGPENHLSSNPGSTKFISPGLSFAEFETVLDEQYSGSHLLYIKLSQQDRQKVYRFYQNDNRISSVREEIVRLLSAG